MSGATVGARFVKTVSNAADMGWTTVVIRDDRRSEKVWIVSADAFDKKKGIGEGMLDVRMLPQHLGAQESFHVKSKMMENHKGVQSSTEARPPAPIDPAHILIEDYGLATFHIRAWARRYCARRTTSTIARRLRCIDQIDDDIGARTSDPSRTGCKTREILSTPVSVVHLAYARGTQCQHPARHRRLVPFDITCPLSPSATSTLPSPPPPQSTPPGSLLAPPDYGSSIPTSQRIIDAIPHAFRVCTASQGCTTKKKP
ncbi:hypothetical protein K488DRAFT_91872 [Vararia minispora EC-137]|uniref:Uncharacterized protein n=1 Tax=Vararia minispora EC-137 TaxID=1314806 RepID=A0ACB8Q5R3_9AGAM|nr:hypothetical protein K488DRAFT_91872 [Vararia minispora EC-137]